MGAGTGVDGDIGLPLEGPIKGWGSMELWLRGLRWNSGHLQGLVPQHSEQDQGRRFSGWIHPWAGQRKIDHRSC